VALYLTHLLDRTTDFLSSGRDVFKYVGFGFGYQPRADEGERPRIHRQYMMGPWGDGDRKWDWDLSLDEIINMHVARPSPGVLVDRSWQTGCAKTRQRDSPCLCAADVLQTSDVGRRAGSAMMDEQDETESDTFSTHQIQINTTLQIAPDT
jgi:hypothetical protein